MTINSILIIDDSEIDRILLKRFLNKEGLTETVFECSNGEEALDFLNPFDENTQKYQGNFPPTLIFLDINMPLMDGFEFLEEFSKLRENDTRYDSIVFTMFSSSAYEKDKERALSHDFVKDYLVKMPDSSIELKLFLKKHFPEL